MGEDKEKTSVKSELRRMFEADQTDRKPAAEGRWDDDFWDEVYRNDKIRLTRVKEMVEGELITTADDYYCAAMVFQHSEVTADYLQAHQLAKISVELGGGPPAKWLVAASLDRYLIHVGPTQKYGTQFRCYDGTWKLAPVDLSTTDEERAEFYVPTLAEQEKRADEMNRTIKR